MQKDMAVQVTLNGVDKLNPKLKEAIGRVNQITANARMAQEKLKSIAITQNQIKGFTDLKNRTDAVKSALEQARNKATELGRATAIGDATKKDFDKARKAVQDLENQYGSLLEKTNKARGALREKGVETTKLAATTRQLREEVLQLNKATERKAKLDQARARAGAMQDRAGSLAMGGAGAVGAGYAVLAPLKAATDAASAFQARLRQIQVTGELTEAQMKALGKSLMDTSAKTGQSTERLLAGNDFLIAAGMKQEVADKAMTPIGKMATAYKAEVESVAAAVYTLNDSFKVDKFEQAMEIMVKADKNGSVKFKEMAAVLPSLGSGFAAMNMKGMEAVATMSASLQIARKGSKSSDEAANNMQNFMVKVLSPETLKKAKEKFGMDLYGIMKKAEKGGGNPMDAAVEAIAKATKGGDQKLLGDLFQDMQVQSFLRPMIQNLDEYKRIKAEALGAMGSGLIDQDFAKSARDMDVTTQRMGNAWENLKTRLGIALEPALQPVIDMLSRATVAMIDFTERHPKLTQFMAILAGIIGVLLVVGGGIALMIAAVLVPMAALTVLAGVLGTALLPVVLIIVGIGVAIAAAVAAFVWFREEMATAWDVFTTTWMQIGAWWQQFSFTDVGRQMVMGLVSGMTEKLQWLVDVSKRLANSAIDAMKSTLGIKSPSRVFAEIGGHTTAGLALGITRGGPAALESVRRVASGIALAGAATMGPGMAAAGAVMPRLQVSEGITVVAADRLGAGRSAVGADDLGRPGAGSGAVTFGPVTIAINGTGLDPEAIAKAVDQRLRAMATQTKTEQQARFFDD